MEFMVNKLWDNGFPTMTKPKIVGYYSINKDKQISYDLSQLKYLNTDIKNGEVRLNLESYYDKLVKIPEKDLKIEHLLSWISYNFKNIINTSSGSSRWLKPDFICYRRLLTKLWTTPYEENNGWIICACKFRGNIYLCSFETESDKKRKELMTPYDKRPYAWGHIFEKYLLSDYPEQKSGIIKQINKTEEFCCIFSTYFGSHSLVYAAQMDGVETKTLVKNDSNLNELKFIELKTNKIFTNYAQEKNFLKATLKWWCKCFLVGIREIKCGFRNDAGIIEEILTYDTSELIKLAKEEWMPGPPMNFCDAFLRYVRRTVRQDYDKCIYKFSWTPKNNVTVEEIDPKSEYTFLPSWFTLIAEDL